MVHFIPKKRILTPAKNCNKLYLLGTLKMSHGSMELPLILEKNCVLKHGVGHQILVRLQLPRVRNHFQKTLLGLERRVHMLETHTAEQKQEAEVFSVVVVGVWNIIGKLNKRIVGGQLLI